MSLQVHSLWGVFASIHRVVLLHAVLFLFLLLMASASGSVAGQCLPPVAPPPHRNYNVGCQAMCVCVGGMDKALHTIQLHSIIQPCSWPDSLAFQENEVPAMSTSGTVLGLGALEAVQGCILWHCKTLGESAVFSSFPGRRGPLALPSSGSL